MNNLPVITLDVDWAPDCIIEDVANLLIERCVKATWFVTHASPAVEALRRHNDLFEMGIHPNFKEGSTHGRTMDEVVAHCLALVPDAVSARSHGLIQSDYLWRHYSERTPIRYECSTYLGPIPCVYPSHFYWKRRSLIRIPFVYQDNIEMDRPAPVWDPASLLEGKQGIQMLNFHPFYIYLNACSMDVFECVKKADRPLQELCEADLLSLRREGIGARTMFIRTLDYLSALGGGCRVRDIEG